MTESFVSGAGQCAKCNGSLVVADDPPTDNSIVTCKSCGQEIGTYSNVHGQIRKATMDHAIAIRDDAVAGLKRSFKKVGRKFR